MRDDEELPEAAGPPPILGALDEEMRHNTSADATGISEMDMEAPHMEQAMDEAAEEQEEAPEEEQQEKEHGGRLRTPGTHAPVRARRTRFLANLRQTGNVRAACRKAGIGKSQAYEWRGSDEWFAEQWDKAMDDFCALVDLAAKRVAMEGLTTPVYHMGVVVGYQTKISEKLLLRLAEKTNPETWGPPEKTTNTRLSGTVQHTSDAERQRVMEELGERVRDILPELARQEAERMIAEGRFPKAIQGRTVES